MAGETDNVTRTAKPCDETVKQTIVETLEAPVLRGVCTEHFAAFKRARELYEQKLEEKNQEASVRVTPTSYKNSVERSILRTMITAGWIKAGSVDAITEDDIKNCVKARAVIDIDDKKDLSVIERAISGVSMDMTIADPENRVWTLDVEYTKALEAAGIENLTDSKPHIAIRHVIGMIRPAALLKQVQDVITWRKNEKFHERDYPAFMRELAVLAKDFERRPTKDATPPARARPPSDYEEIVPAPDLPRRTGRRG